MSGYNRWITKDTISGEQSAFYFVSRLHYVYLFKMFHAISIGSKLTPFKGNELYLRSVKWQQNTTNEDEMQKKCTLLAIYVLF